MVLKELPLKKEPPPPNNLKKNKDIEEDKTKKKSLKVKGQKKRKKKKKIAEDKTHNMIQLNKTDFKISCRHKFCCLFYGA